MAMFPDSSEASRRYGEVFLTLTRRSVDTNTFRRLSEIGLPHAEEHLLLQFVKFVSELVGGPDFDKYFLDREAALDYFGGVGGMAASMTSNELSAYQRSIDTASVVFAHSAVDAATSELCWITAFSSPDDWEPFVGAKKVSLSEVREFGVENLWAVKTSDHLKALERESLLKRVDRLFRLCQPEQNFEGVLGFRFDRDRLKRLDELRHRIVHQDVDESAFVTVEKDLEFLFQSGLHLWAMVNAKYGVKVDVRNFVGLSDFKLPD